MKLLIVDDEKLTREGIRHNVLKDFAPFDTILLADDGVHGLQLALKEQPEIILTDVRMPRMSGVEMIERVLSQNPDTAVIFMSAYSNKEYLKAAIKLKAVSYVDKPLSMTELYGVLSEAVQSFEIRTRTKSAVRFQEKEQMGHLALLLINPHRNSLSETDELIQQLNLSITSATNFVCLILDCMVPLSELPEEPMDLICSNFTAFLESRGIFQIYAFWLDHAVIIHLYSDKHLDERTLEQCTAFLQKAMNGICHFFLAVGPIVTGIKHIHLSYEKAKQLLEKSFFHESDCILTEIHDNSDLRPPADVLMDFGLSLSEKKKEQALLKATQLYESLMHGHSLAPSQVKDIYNKYFVKLDENGMANHISLWNGDEAAPQSIWDGIMHCITLSELHHLLTDKVLLYFQLLEEKTGENPVVFQIKEYIHQNYAVPSLSVLDVSDHVHRSSSYVCTLFKNETGQTLNQYLTIYRVKMSKQFLSDSRYKITDISSKVGYSDGNYYSKTFRKIVGLSPSEYREKMLS